VTDSALVAAELLEVLRELPHGVLHWLGRGLVLGAGPLAHVGSALECEADGCHELAALKLRYARRHCGYDAALLERLERAEEPPWPSVLAAIRAVAENVPVTSSPGDDESTALATHRPPLVQEDGRHAA
jgi:hypothetical protein